MGRYGGRYVVFEGIDGCGKTTLLDAVFYELRGENHFGLAPIRFPSDGIIGTVIRDALRGTLKLDRKAFLFLFVADAMHENRDIKRWLAAGEVVLCDRHPAVSAEVFQVEEWSIDDVEGIYKAASNGGLCDPDELFILDLPVEVARERMARRVKYKDVVYESDDDDRLDILRERYKWVADKRGGHVLDATKDVSSLVADVRRLAGL